MEQLWIEKKFPYDGSQLRPLYAYLEHKLLGDSIISWAGPCLISQENIKDGEDLLAGAAIRGDEMLHFIIEIFHQSLFSGVACQRLFASIVKDTLEEMAADLLQANPLRRDGDDIFWQDGKLSISIASQSSVATQIHFALNITNSGTPVKTACLKDLGIAPKEFAMKLMDNWRQEFFSMVKATKKVIPLT